MAAIYPRDGRWRVQWRHGGKQPVRSFRTEKQAERFAALLAAVGHDRALAALAEPPPEVDAPPLAVLLEQHINNLTGIEDGTKRRYRALGQRHIAPALGTVPVDHLTRDMVAGWVNDLSRSGLSGKSVRNIHSLLSATLQTAVMGQLVPTNVAKGLRMPSTTRDAEPVFLDEDEVRRLVGLTPEPWRPLVALLVTSGLRFGEATALTVSDIDLRAGTIRVRRAWKATAGEGHKIGPPKSKRGRRTIPLPRSVRAAVAELMKGRAPDEWLFTNSRGGPVRHASFHSHVWTPLVHEFAGDEIQRTGKVGRRRLTWHEGGNGKRPRIHDLRHTFASLAIKAGMTLTALQRHMGHESIQTTSDVYGHLYQADRDAFASIVQVDLAEIPALEA